MQLENQSSSVSLPTPTTLVVIIIIHTYTHRHSRRGAPWKSKWKEIVRVPCRKVWWVSVCHHMCRCGHSNWLTVGEHYVVKKYSVYSWFVYSVPVDYSSASPPPLYHISSGQRCSCHTNACMRKCPFELSSSELPEAPTVANPGHNSRYV